VRSSWPAAFSIGNGHRAAAAIPASIAAGSIAAASAGALWNFTQKVESMVCIESMFCIQKRYGTVA